MWIQGCYSGSESTQTPGRPALAGFSRPGARVQTRRRELGGTHAACACLVIGPERSARYALMAIPDGNALTPHAAFRRPAPPKSEPGCRHSGVGARARLAGVSLPG